jgi:hypothetical protein
MIEENIHREEIESLPIGVSIPFLEAIRICRHYVHANLGKSTDPVRFYLYKSKIHRMK